MANKYVHEDILNNILSRLPTKPLVRCKCVSKHWNRLISDPKFMKMRSRRMILFPVQPFYAIDNMTKSVMKLCSTLEYPEGTQFFVDGTFNGIVLLFRNSPWETLMLYNPFTGAFKKVPKSLTFDHDYIYGFGYGTTPDDIKIVIFNRYRCRPNALKSCYVFSLKSWSWSTSLKSVVGDYFFLNYHGVFVNGFLYWITVRDEFVIVSLDIKNMVFSEIQLPADGRPLFFPLGTLNGLLCTVCCHGDAHIEELWVMNEEDRSWFKVCSLKLLCGFQQDKFRPLCILDDGNLVMWKKPYQIIIYNMLKDSHTTIYEEKISISLNQERIPQAIQYVESLISPSDMCLVLGLPLSDPF